jgi:putative tryptophan/tyrosine transport system substrate-binding protein
MGGKWLELLKEIVPDLRRVAVIFNPDTGPLAPLYLHSVETAATLFSVKATDISVHENSDIERAISSVAQELSLSPVSAAWQSCLMPLSGGRVGKG